MTVPVSQLKLSSEKSISESDNILTYTVHSIKIQISSTITLKLTMFCNDIEIEGSAVAKVDQTSRIANYNNSVFTINLDKD